MKAGEDQALTVFTWDPVAGDYVEGTTAWNRLCSADLPAPDSLFYRGHSTKEEIFLNGEEYDERFPADADNTAGRAFAHSASGKLDGQSWKLPRLGRMAFENVLASPYPQERAVVMLMDDADRVVDPNLTSSASELYVYVGKKQRKGNPIERAGLTNGDLLGSQLFVDGQLVTQESNEFGLGTTEYVGKGTFKLHSFRDVSALGGNLRLGKIWLYGTETDELIEVAAHNPKSFLASAGSPKKNPLQAAP